jgi:hypothetical protein
LNRFQRAAWNNPGKFASAWLGVDLWARQEEALRMFTNNRFSAVCSGHAVGKTMLMAVAVFLCLVCRRGFAVTTASGFRGTEKGVWPVIHRIIGDLPPERAIGGRLNDTSLRLGPQWEAFAVAAKSPENFASFRSPGGTTILVDEASGLTPDIYEAIMGLAAGGGRVFMAGNPLRSTGPFAEVFRDPAWATMRISSLEAAAAGVPGLADDEWIAGRRRAWGEDSDRYRTRVLGEFPREDELNVVPLDWLPAVILDGDEEEPPRRGALTMGVDVARHGRDATVLAIRDEAALREIIRRGGSTSTMEVAGLVRATAEEWGVRPEAVRVDDSGLGGGVTDRLHEQDIPVEPVNFGAGAVDREHFRNRRAECYWALRSALSPDRDGGPWRVPRRWAGALEEANLADVRLDSSGRIQLESKDEVKRKNDGRSPDEADALALSFAPPAEGDRQVEVMIA